MLSFEVFQTVSSLSEPLEVQQALSQPQVRLHMSGVQAERVKAVAERGVGVAVPGALHEGSRAITQEDGVTPAVMDKGLVIKRHGGVVVFSLKFLVCIQLEIFCSLRKCFDNASLL